MSISVAYTSQLKLALGIDREQVDVDTPCTVEQLLARLLDRHGSALRRLICDPAGKLQRSVLVCVGDEQVDPGSNKNLQAGDTVTLIAPISGG